MIFVDSNVLMYAVGGEHPHRSEARDFFRHSVDQGLSLVTSAEVLQELLHAYLPTDRTGVLDAALTLAAGRIETVWPVEEADVRLARRLSDEHPRLDARDVLHLASCRRRDVSRLETFDQELADVLD